MEMTKEMEDAVYQVKETQTLEDQIKAICKMVCIAKKDPTHDFAKKVLDFADKYYSMHCLNLKYLDELDDLFWRTDELRMMIKGI